MAVSYYVVPLIFRREYPARALCRLQPYVFALGDRDDLVRHELRRIVRRGSAPLGHRVHRRRAPGWLRPERAHLARAWWASAALVAFTGLIMYVGLTVAAVFFGKKVDGKILAW